MVYANKGSIVVITTRIMVTNKHYIANIISFCTYKAIYSLVLTFLSKNLEVQFLYFEQISHKHNLITFEILRGRSATDSKWKKEEREDTRWRNTAEQSCRIMNLLFYETRENYVNARHFTALENSLTPRRISSSLLSRAHLFRFSVRLFFCRLLPPPPVPRLH